jgi:hypothetical protein
MSTRVLRINKNQNEPPLRVKIFLLSKSPSYHFVNNIFEISTYVQLRTVDFPIF